MHFTIINLCSKLLIKKNYTVAFVETFTSGRLTHDFSIAEDSSVFLKGGIVCFSKKMAGDLLGIDKEILINNEINSMEANKAMALGLSRLVPDVNLHIAVAGFTAPQSGEDKNNLEGTVFIHALLNSEILFSRQFHFEGNEAEIINQSIMHVAYYLRDSIENRHYLLTNTA